MSFHQLLRPLCVIAITAASLLPLSAANLILNGDFSGGTSGTLTGATGGSNNVPTNWSGFATGSGSLRVLSGRVNFNGNNQPTGSYIEQSVTTSANLWYALDWLQAAHTGGDSGGVMVATTLTSGPATTTNSYRGLATPNLLIFTSGVSTTVRLSDVGASTVSLDTRIDNVSFDLADGQYNVASIATLSSDSQYPAGSWGNMGNAVDGRTGGSDNTVFHNNSNNGYLELDFTTNFVDSYIDRIELVARPGFNSRKGDTIEIYSTSGSLIESIDISSNTASSYGIDGVWKKVGRIRVIENGQTLNISEIRTFSSFVNGVAVPEPSSSSLLALSGIALLLRRRK